VPLFNGKDLSGWVEVGKEKWTVENGVIRGQATSKEYGYLRTEKNYKTSSLPSTSSAKVRATAASSSTPNSRPHQPHHQGCNSRSIAPWGPTPEGCTGRRAWIVWPAPENEIVVRRGEWNEYLLKVERQPLRVAAERRSDGRFHRPNPKSFDGGISLQLHSGGAATWLSAKSTSAT